MWMSQSGLSILAIDMQLDRTMNSSQCAYFRADQWQEQQQQETKLSDFLVADRCHLDDILWPWEDLQIYKSLQWNISFFKKKKKTVSILKTISRQRLPKTLWIRVHFNQLSTIVMASEVQVLQTNQNLKLLNTDIYDNSYFQISFEIINNPLA